MSMPNADRCGYPGCTAIAVWHIIPQLSEDNGTTVACETHVAELAGQYSSPDIEPIGVAIIAYEGVTVTIARSAGLDAAMVVFIDTTFEPDGSDGRGLRVLINNDPTYEGVPYEAMAD